ncbi:4-hydroxy-2-oxovalerate aldolase (plasmid) [Deinococcus proteolyticus MRP]|uniref:4-hydroxy-2-oxovalerate aldolase n=1 Tax=Deinococcus proteolyticus (strain ATCC 35074 / DSM 20540 / JCM 6276 / NBRC 101906 / NCIMB 13154 / VKM Ac-1939 / CCM 2703 / MRP) TaxID=693977 RepID=F0RPG4_DEIPM|nr:MULTISPECIES: HpcH/HpaI aldolase/citrate lyase family protein [Deinococcus]ADY27270.1 4-hydroxy-2-oxovalerate aldolase [Deinococcus proteolyticus MRP]MCY1704139.1 HpcH/HpaI aldolase/citrate lyase family protein [Deinococcus sp. SL84]
MTYTNPFKAALQRGEPQYGYWLALAHPYAAEAVAGAGFEWLLIDGEHAPNTVPSVLAQLQALAPYAGEAIVRPVNDDRALIKQLLDIGARTLLIPMVDTTEQAAAAVAATRYPPAGVRGVASALVRASRWGTREGYLAQAEQEICVLVQVESATGLSNLAAIAATEGVDGVFIGPADLSASLGHLGQPNHPDVQAAIREAAQTIRAAGKAAGILAVQEKDARRYLDWGYTFVAVGVDVLSLTQGARATLNSLRRDQ